MFLCIALQFDIPIDVPDDVGEISTSVRGPNKEHIDNTLTKEKDGLYHIRFIPPRSGRYTVDVLCAGHHIENSPMFMNVQEAAPINVKLKEFDNQVSKHENYASLSMAKRK
jgi:hypothetical protein